MIRYAAFEYFYLLWLVPAFGLLAWLEIRRSRRALQAFAGSQPVWRLTGAAGSLRLWVKASLRTAALLLLVVALAKPQWGTRRDPIHGQGRDVLIALDVSRSMLAEDLSPNRLERAKADVRDLIDAAEAAGGHRIGLIAFAGQASLKCPLTQVYSHLRLVLDEIGPRSVARGGTLLGDCIRAAVAAFDDKTQNFRDLIVITDGEDTEESFPREAAAAARDAGITIYVVGLGDATRGAEIPVVGRSGDRTALQFQGETVRSKLNEPVLQGIAEITGGVYVSARTSSIRLDRIFREHIEPRAKRQQAAVHRDRPIHRYQWLLAPAVCLLLLDWWMTARRARGGVAAGPDGLAPPTGATTVARRQPVQSVLPMVLLAVLVAAAGPLDSPRQLVQSGNHLFQEGKYADATAQYERAAQRVPDVHIPRFNQAAGLFGQGKYVEAAQAYHEARGRAPAELVPTLNYALGNCYLQAAAHAPSPPAAAIEHLTTALRHYRDVLDATRGRPDRQSLEADTRYNIELGKRLLHELRQQQPPQQTSRQPQESPEQQQDPPPESKPEPPKPKPDQSRDEPGPPQPDGKSAPDSPSSKPESPEGQAGRQPRDWSPDEAADQLKAALNRVQVLRSHRLNRPDARARVPAVLRDW
jgi:Ca-activated chloride channel family protein